MEVLCGMSEIQQRPVPPCRLWLTAPSSRCYESGYDDRLLLPRYGKILTTLSELALICGLSLSNVSNILKNGSLGEASLMPFAPLKDFDTYPAPPEELNDRSIEEGLREAGPDWLGRYYHGQDEPRRIEVHLPRCRRTAEFLGVSPRNLVEVVWTHEAAHFVSHIGIGGYDQSIWNDFSGASSYSKEDVAQTASLVAFTLFARPRLFKVMEKLAKYQSQKYNTWREFKLNWGWGALQNISELTLKVGNASGRAVSLPSAPSCAPAVARP
jgi:hypothetical protein